MATRFVSVPARRNRTSSPVPPPRDTFTPHIEPATTGPSPAVAWDPPPPPRPTAQPSNLELFVCQRVSAELQPLLDGWRDSVRAELLAVREASSDAAEWREAVSAELTSVLAEQRRTTDAVSAASARLAEAPPVKLAKQLEKQEEHLLESIKGMHDSIIESRLSFERAEAGSRADKRSLHRALTDEKKAAIALSRKALEESEAQGRELAARLSAAEEQAKKAASRALSGEQRAGEVKALSMQLERAHADQRSVSEQLAECMASRTNLEGVAAVQAVHCSVLGESLAAAERDSASEQRAILVEAGHAARALVEASTRHEDRRARSHAEWLAATREVVPLISKASQELVHRLEEAAQKAEGTSGAVEAWRGRALTAEEEAEAAKAARSNAEAKERSSSEACARLRLDVKLLSASLHDVEREAASLRRQEADTRAAAAEMASLIASMEAAHASLVALGASVMQPLRELELRASTQEMRCVEASAAAASSSAAAERAATIAVRLAEEAWTEERRRLLADRDEAKSVAEQRAAERDQLLARLSEEQVQRARADERCDLLQKEASLAAGRTAAMVAEREATASAGREEVMRERAAADEERESHTRERAALVRQLDEARSQMASAASESASSIAALREQSRAEMDQAKELAAQREVEARSAAEALRIEYEVYRREAGAVQLAASEKHSRELAALHDRIARLAATFESEVAKQRERAEVMVVEAKAAAGAQHEVALRAAAEGSAATEAKYMAAVQSSKAAAEHHKQAMRSLAREHAATVRAERHLASQELAACRERAEDAERRFDLLRHSGQAPVRACAGLTYASDTYATEPIGAIGATATAARATDVASGTGEEAWESLRRRQEVLGSSRVRQRALKITELNGSLSSMASPHDGTRSSASPVG